MEVFIVKIIKSFLKAVNPADIPRNKKLMAAFMQLFEEIEADMPAGGNQGFFAIPLHHVFSYYFTRLIMQNFLMDVQKKPAGKSEKDLFMDIFKRFVDIPHGVNQWKYLQKLLETILRPLGRAWAFVHEISSGKWVMSGLFITQLAKIHYTVYEYHLFSNIALF